MRLASNLRDQLSRHRTLALLVTILSVFSGCGACYLAGAYLENGDATILKVTLCILALLLCAASLLYQTVYWLSEPRECFGRLRVNLFVQLIAIDILTLLLSFAIYGPIGSAFPRSFIAVSRLAPGAFIFLFLLVSALSLVAIRASAFSRFRTISTRDNGISYEASLPWFLLLYFLLLIAPYSFAPIPAINSFLTGSGKIPYRLFTTVLLGGYSLYLWIKYRIKPRFDFLIPMSFLWLSFTFACTFAPRSFSYVAEGLNGSFHFVELTYSGEAVWVQLPLLMADCFVFFCFVSFYSQCVQRRRQVLIPLIGISLYVLAACLYSYAFEFRSYIDFITGSDQSKGAIQSWTQSKNAFGILLFHGAFVSGFLFYFVKKWWKYLFVAFSFVLLATSYIVQCYSALVPILVVCIAVCVLIVRGILRRKKLLGYAMLGLSFALMVMLILCVSVPSIYESSAVLGKINQKIAHFLDHEILSRTGIWGLALVVCRGPFVFIGKSSMAEMEFYLRESAALQMAYPDFHSSFVSALGTFGMSGLLMYIFAIGYVMKSIWRISHRKTLLLITACLLLSCILFSMPETYSLFLSMSAITLPFNYVFIVFLPFLGRTANE